ncbi:MAG: carboxypeptidase-like regulatory domain-containing protein [Candidatus Contendobacter sp.]
MNSLKICLFESGMARIPMMRLLTFFLLALALVGCDPATQAKGTLRDGNGNPLSGVVVVLQSRGDAALGSPLQKEVKQTTGTDGSFNFVTITASAHQASLVISKAGYKEVTKKLKPNRENDLQVIVLEPQ